MTRQARRIAGVALGALAVAATAGAQARQAGPAQPSRPAAGARSAVTVAPCPEGRRLGGDLGIGWYHCPGGSCWVSTGRAHGFSAEPRIWDVDPEGPAGGKLRDGDVLVAIDGALVTTPEGGRRLANLTAGVPVTLRVRRSGEEGEEGEESNVRVVPGVGCNMVALIVTDERTAGRPDVPSRLPGAARAGSGARAVVQVAPAKPAEPAAWLGLVIGCELCGWETTPDGAPLWRSHVWPVVRGVEKGSPADEAGFEAGDVVTHVDRLSLLTIHGGRRLGAVAPGETIVLTYRRHDHERTATLTAKPRPATGSRM